MKKCFLLLLALIGYTALFAQSPVRVPDADAPDPGSAWYYYENRGQIIDKAQNIRNDIKYYTTHSGVKMYLGDDTISFTGHTRSIANDTVINDTSFRLDMQFFCSQRDANQPCPNTIAVYEPSRDSLNYYLPHCGSGIEGVPGFGGVVYQNAFPSTDVHFFSNPQGPVTYFVFHPTADTSAFALLFHGQDSIQALANYLHAYIGHHDIWFPDGVAYQVDPYGAIVPLSWTPTWYKASSSMVKMQFGSYNPAFDLVIRTGQVGQITAGGGTDNLVWTTYYGRNGSEANPDPVRNWSMDGMPIIKSGLEIGSPVVWHAMTTNSDSFDVDIGSVWKASSGLDSTLAGSYDCIVSQFEGTTGQRKWATYFGGSGYEEVGALAIIDRPQLNNNTLGNLLLGGRTTSDTLTGLSYPVNIGWWKKTNIPATGGNTGSFIASFSASLGRLKYTTFIGGGKYCYLDGMVWDEAKREIVFNGYISANNWSIVDTISNTPSGTTMSLRRNGRYFQTTNKDLSSAFIGSFDSARNLVWCTLIGGDSLDVINLVVPDKSGGLYALGNTRSRYEPTTVISTSPLYAPNSSPVTLPFVQPSSNAFCQTDMNWRRAYVAHFNSARAIDWGTLYGGGRDNEYLGLAVNSKNDVYVAGVASFADTIRSNQPDASGYHRLPTYDAIGGSYMQGYGSLGFTGNNNGLDAVIARFDSTHRLRWSTLFGQLGSERAPVRLAIDHADHVYMSGNNEIDTIAIGGPQGIPIYKVTGRYQQDSNASSPYSATLNTKLETSDGWIVQFNPANQPIWSTFFGGKFTGYHPVSASTITTNSQDAREIITSTDVITKNGIVSLYMTGVTKNPFMPTKFSNGTRRIVDTNTYDDQVHGGNWDSFIGMFDNVRATAVPSIISPHASNSIIVAPNPSHDRFTITFNNGDKGCKVPMMVTNALGQVLLSSDVTLVPGNNKFMLDLEQLPAGVYFLQFALQYKAEAVWMVKY